MSDRNPRKKAAPPRDASAPPSTNAEVSEGAASSVAVQVMPIGSLKANPSNPRVMRDEKFAKLKKSIQDFPDMLNYRTLVAVTDGDHYMVLGGNMRLRAMQDLGIKTAPVMLADDWTEEQRRRFIIADNIGFGEHDWSALANEWDAVELADWGLDLPIGFAGEQRSEGASSDGPSLADRFMVPPFSVLNARDGWWQDRKRGWIAKGIKSELGRGDNGFGNNGGSGASLGQGLQAKKGKDGKLYYEDIHKARAKAFGTEGNISDATGTSIFDPVMCEIAYRWFCPEGGTIIDPFAGGSVRGIVASHVGRQYIGIELRKEQVVANRLQEGVAVDPVPVWHEGDSMDIGKICKGVSADMLFTCPPYADLEIYSDNPADISTMKYPEFLVAYRQIVQRSALLLADDSFACVVVGEVRDKKGNYYNFVGDTIKAFIDAGLSYYNEMILVTSVGSLPIRAGRAFTRTRKIGKTHQNVLVFVKGDGKRAAGRCGHVEVPDLMDTFDEAE